VILCQAHRKKPGMLKLLKTCDSWLGSPREARDDGEECGYATRYRSRLTDAKVGSYVINGSLQEAGLEVGGGKTRPIGGVFRRRRMKAM